MTPVPAAATRTVAPARACAYRVLRRVFEQGAYAEKALIGEAGDLDPRDRALAMRLSYGAVQRRGTTDHLVGGLAGRPAEQLDAPLLAALRLGLYELLYLAGAPDYAVIDDAVELAKTPHGKGHGLVNAVLRRAAREGREKLLDGLSDATPGEAAVKHSHPQWIAELWWDALGPEQARALMARDNEPAELALRANTLRADASTLAERLGVASHRDPRIAEALVIDGPLDIHATPQWAEGAYTAQSRAAMLVSLVVAAPTGRAAARPVRGARRQEHPSGSPDGGPWRAGRGRAQRAPGKEARTDRSSAGRGEHQSRGGRRGARPRGRAV